MCQISIMCALTHDAKLHVMTIKYDFITARIWILHNTHTYRVHYNFCAATCMCGKWTSRNSRLLSLWLQKPVVQALLVKRCGQKCDQPVQPGAGVGNQNHCSVGCTREPGTQYVPGFFLQVYGRLMAVCIWLYRFLSCTGNACS